MSRRLLLFAVLFALVAGGVVWDRANLGLAESEAASAPARSEAIPPLPDDADEIVFVVGGGHSRSAPASAPVPDERLGPPGRPRRSAAAPPRDEAPPPHQPRERRVRVAAGETLRSIASRELGDPSLWEALARANGIADPKRLREGDELVIPAATDR
jgi:hypothetical protein